MRGLRALPGTHPELNAVILVHRDGRVQHIHGAEHLGGLVDAVLGVAGKSLDERREVCHRDFLTTRSLAASEGDLDDGDTIVIQPDLDGITGDGESGGVDSGREQLGHDGLP